MITYSTQFPVSETYAKDLFVNMVIKWNQGSKYDKFESLNWGGENYQLLLE